MTTTSSLAMRPRTVRALVLVLGIAYALGLLHPVAAAALADSASERAAWLLNAVPIALWGALTLVLLRGRPDDMRARLFALTGMAVSATIVFESYPPPGAPFGVGGYIYLFLACFIYYINPPVILHMCSWIPGRNRLLEGRRWIVPALYLAYTIFAVILFLLFVNVLKPFLPWRPNGETVDSWRIGGSMINYALTGIAGLALLGHAARHEPSAIGRRQALVVFASLAPWTLGVLLMLLVPAFRTSTVGEIAHELTVGLVPIGLFVAIAGFRLFDLAPALRRGLIVGTALGLALAIVFVIARAADEVLSQRFGVPLIGWGVAALLLLAGMAGQPLLQSMADIIDRRFFRERQALQSLRRNLIPALAAQRQVDAIGGYLVRELSTALGNAPASLLLADAGEAFYRPRASSPEPLNGARAVGLPAEWLNRWEAALESGDAIFPQGDAPAELRALMTQLDARCIVPITLDRRAIGLLLIGASTAWEPDTAELELVEDIAQLASAMLENARLFDLASNDPLTRLPRRHVAEERIAFELERSRRSKRPLAVALADIDHFKQINDTHGHQTGDRVLAAVAAALSTRSRRIDLVARWGGEEFLMVWAETDSAGASVHAEALRAAVETLAIPAGNGSDVRPMISIGVCAPVPDSPVTADEIIRCADAALYEAKAAGRNRVAIT